MKIENLILRPFNVYCLLQLWPCLVLVKKQYPFMNILYFKGYLLDTLSVL